jgi:WD40 repeat protein
MICINHPWEGIYVKNRILLLFFLLLLAAGFGCSDKSSGPDNKPEPYYKLLYSYVQPPVSVLTFNTRTGEILDSVWYPGEPYRDLAFSHDGEYTYATDRVTRIIKESTGDTIASDWEHRGYELVLSPDEQYLVVKASQEIWVLRLPSLSVVYHKPITYFWGRFHPTKQLLYINYGIPGYGVDTLLYVLDLSVTPPVERSVALFDSLGERVPAAPMEISGDGRWLLMIYYNWLFLVDTDSLKVRKVMKSLHFAEADYTDFTLHPDGKRAFLSYYDPWDNPNVGGLDIFDFSTQTLTNYIDHTTVPGLSRPFRPVFCRFTPDGKELIGIVYETFMCCEIFRIDLATKAISLFTARRGEYPRVLKINPKPFY